MQNQQRILTFIFLILFIDLVRAESVKLIQWWDQYLPMRTGITGFYRGNPETVTSRQKLDLDNDGVSNDAQLSYNFSLTESLNPGAPCQPDSKKWYAYRVDRPSGKFYGGMVVRFTNVSDLMRTDQKDTPLFSKIPQSSVQQDGASPGLYSKDFPNNTVRGRGYNNDYWSDMTLFPVDPSWGTITKTFWETPDIQVNFASVFLWKKADFVNGGASAKKITFDATSKFTVDLTRFRKNIEDARFVVQDGERLWISQYVIDVNSTNLVKGKQGATFELNPRDSLWAKYTPSGANVDFDVKSAKFVTREFQDVQAVGVYFASTEFSRKETMLAFDNFQLYAAITPTTDAAIEQNPVGLAVNKAGEFIPTTAQFSRGSTINGSAIQAKTTDIIDVRGVITVESAHVGQAADILMVVAYQADSTDKLTFFMFDEKGGYYLWDGQFSSLVALQKIEKIDPEERVNLFPLAIEVLQNDEILSKEVVSGCGARPLTYTGMIGFPGIFKFYYGYRLTDGTIVFNRDSIDIEIKE